MLDNEKIGKFLKELRISHNLSQTTLSYKLYVSRQAISLWETGKNLPDIDKVRELANLYNITIADIYAGEILKDKQEENKIVSGVIKRQISKTKRVTFIGLFIILILVFAFLTYYFISYYKQVSVYMISSDEDEYKINGIITKSVNQLYFNLETDKDVEKICLLYKNNDVSKNIICRENSNFVTFKEHYGYEEYLSNISFDDFIKNIYIVIDDKEIKLEIYQDFINNQLFLQNKEKISEDDETIKSFEIPKKIKEKFKYNSNLKRYSLSIKNKTTDIILTYDVNSKTFSVSELSNIKYKEWNFDVKKDSLLSYLEIDKKKNMTIKEYTKSEKMNDDILKEYDYFIKNYKNIYLN